jgi:hypothetical protein
MKDTDIKIGKVYDITVGKNTSAVRIMRLATDGGEGWEAASLKNNSPVIVRSASRIVGVHNPKADKVKPVEEPSKDAKAKKERTTTKPGGLSAALRVLEEAGTPLNCQEMVKQMLEKGYWKTDGKTPSSTIYSAIIREIKAKGDASRFRKTERGKFAIAAK